MGEGAEPGAGNPGSGEDGGAGEGEGGGYGSGSAGERSQSVSGLDPITTPHQVPAGSMFNPDEFGTNDYLGQPGEGAVRAEAESVSPNLRREPTHGNDTSTIPLGLRDLVKDYFSSLDQR
jgi:hypothetical protein